MGGSLSRPDRTDRARVLARKAAGDARAMRQLAGVREIDDEAVGLHAQQAIEKWLKAVVVSEGLEFAWGHDLGRQLRVLASGEVELPPGADWLDELSIYASTMRYEDLLDAEPLDRDRVVALVDAIGEWAERLLASDGRS